MGIDEWREGDYLIKGEDRYKIAYVYLGKAGGIKPINPMVEVVISKGATWAAGIREVLDAGYNGFRKE